MVGDPQSGSVGGIGRRVWKNGGRLLAATDRFTCRELIVHGKTTRPLGRQRQRLSDVSRAQSLTDSANIGIDDSGKPWKGGGEELPRKRRERDDSGMMGREPGND